MAAKRMQAPRHWYAPQFDSAGKRVEVYDGERRADVLPQSLIDQRVGCEECGASFTEEGSSDSRIDWVETGFMARHGDETEMEKQSYCVLHYGGRPDVYPNLDPKFLLDD